MEDSSQHRDSIRQSPADKSRSATLQREAILTRGEPDLVKFIEDTILFSVPSSHRISRKEHPLIYVASFDLIWDPLAFVREQQYAETPEEALERAITLTGCPNDAQALTAKAYLDQTWPVTGSHVMKLVTDLVCNPRGHYIKCELCNSADWAFQC